MNYQHPPLSAIRFGIHWVGDTNNRREIYTARGGGDGIGQSKAQKFIAVVRTCLRRVVFATTALSCFYSRQIGFARLAKTDPVLLCIRDDVEDTRTKGNMTFNTIILWPASRFLLFLFLYVVNVQVFFIVYRFHTYAFCITVRTITIDMRPPFVGVHLESSTKVYCSF